MQKNCVLGDENLDSNCDEGNGRVKQGDGGCKCKDKVQLWVA